MLTASHRDYRILTAETVPAYLADIPTLRERLGGSASEWRARDVADGNLNAVFLIDGPKGGLCLKQALPYVRVAGESWPLDINRATFEYRYATRVAPHVGALQPQMFHYDADQYIIVMEKLEPHIILRKALISGTHYPRVPVDNAEFLANTAFHTSDLAVPFERKAADMEVFARNLALQRITVDLVYTDPYVDVWRNKISEPLGAWAEALKRDIDLKDAVTRARLAYLSKAQSLLHGDLHSGSIMVTADETRIIDSEFAWVGPTGFDTGNFIAHYVMAWFAKPFQPNQATDATTYRALLTADIVSFWQRFEERFLAIWRAFDGDNDGVPATVYASAVDRARLESFRRAYVADLFADTVQVLGIEIIRRIIGYAQIADFHVIEDVATRAEAQAGALAFARSLLIHPERYQDIASVVAALARFENAGLLPDTTRHL